MKSPAQAYSRILINGTFLVCLVAGAAHTAGAQPQPLASASPMNNGGPVQTKTDARPLSSATTDTRYRIGPGDVLDVRVARAPELSREAVRVDQSGMIRMPMLDDDIQAACLTEGELAQSIAKHYLKFKREPHVDVFVKEFQSQPVSVTGAVRAAASFRLQRQVTLLELLSFAGGPSENAGQTIQIVHTGGPSPCDKGSDATNDNASSVTYKLSETQRGVPEANPYVRPGDIVQVLVADQVYVVGNVLRPTAIPLKEPITISKAIAMAGGTAPATKKDKIRIIRQLPGSTTKEEVYVDLGAIEKRKSDDILLLPNDIVDVPISGTKSLLRSLMGAVVPAVTQLPVRVIP